MNNRIDERINRIKKDRQELLLVVSSSIKNNGNIVSADVKKISEIIDYDEKCLKNYEAIIKTQNLIASLTEAIASANSEEEIIKIRKKLNYYINKVKMELKKRNVSEEYVNKYSESIGNLRKDVAKYIRVLKRENKLLEIDKLYHESDKLMPEEYEKFQKLVSNEIRYNRRNLNYKSKENKEKNIEVVTPVTIIEPSIEEEKTQEVSEPVTNVEYLAEDVIVDAKNEGKIGFILSSKDFKNVDIEYFNSKIESYDRQYQIQVPYSYEKSIFTRVNSMFKNIPLYKQNKKIIKKMKDDSQMYFSNNELISYIAYLTKVNSIKHGLKSIFNKTYLYSREGKLLNDHTRCMEWLLNYCRKNFLGVKLLSRKVMS